MKIKFLNWENSSFCFCLQKNNMGQIYLTSWNRQKYANQTKKFKTRGTYNKGHLLEMRKNEMSLRFAPTYSSLKQLPGSGTLKGEANIWGHSMGRQMWVEFTGQSTEEQRGTRRLVTIRLTHIYSRVLIPARIWEFKKIIK